MELINRLYEASDVSDMTSALFGGLRLMVPFHNAMFLSVDGGTFELQPGYGWNCAAEDINLYLEQYTPLDPFVTALPLPERLNRAIRLSDLTSRADLARTGFSDFQRQLPFRYALSVVAAWNRQPMAVLRLYRGLQGGDFKTEDLDLLSNLAPHIAHALFLQKAQIDEDQHLCTEILVLAADGRIIFHSETAQDIPPEVINELLLLDEQDGSLCLNHDSKFYRARVIDWRPPSLLTCFAKRAGVTPNRQGTEGALLSDGSGDDAFNSVSRNLNIIALEPFRRREDIASRLQYTGMSSREIEVALRVMSGCSNADIAHALFIDEKTVKDHLSHIYQKIKVRSRTQLISQIFGLNFIWRSADKSSWTCAETQTEARL
ncbi:LuxR C-terminal-related transcriptional regulator [Methylomicrobium lacus]|uniref:LuxR C-terminal-related transcriptional regulator n=1 Tax=Methylomicrobium lacus TaxID=136992 RepID=UPI0035A87C11